MTIEIEGEMLTLHGFSPTKMKNDWPFTQYSRTQSNYLGWFYHSFRLNLVPVYQKKQLSLTLLSLSFSLSPLSLSLSLNNMGVIFHLHSHICGIAWWVRTPRHTYMRKLRREALHCCHMKIKSTHMYTKWIYEQCGKIWWSSYKIINKLSLIFSFLHCHKIICLNANCFLSLCYIVQYSSVWCVCKKRKNLKFISINHWSNMHLNLKIKIFISWYI